MRQSQAEIKAIRAKLRSIQAQDEKSRRSPSTLPEQSHYSRSDNTRNSATRNPGIGNPVTELFNRQPLNPQVQPNQQPQRNQQPQPTQMNEVQNYQTQNYQTQGDSAQGRSAYVSKPQSFYDQDRQAGSSFSGNLPPDLTDPVERPLQRSPAFVQPLQQFPPHSFPETPEQLMNETLLNLEAQAQHINQLAAVQESAILELKAIAEKVEREWKAMERASRSPFDPPIDPTEEEIEVPPICEYRSAIVPQVEKNESGVLVLTARSVDLFKAEREATLMAETLRYRAKQGRSPDEDTVISGYHKPRRQRSRLNRFSLNRFSMWETGALVIGAIVLRLALNFVLAALPGLWTPLILLLATSLAIAVFRTPITAQSGLVWGSRLGAVLIGLLLGGRL